MACDRQILHTIDPSGYDRRATSTSHLNASCRVAMASSEAQRVRRPRTIAASN
jgi:hypothetical protein